MPKNTIQFVCRQCGAEQPKWLGQCPQCGEWGTLEEAPTLAASSKSASSLLRSSFAGQISSGLASRPTRLSDVPSSEQEGRASTGIGEFDRVLGGGIVRGALMLVGGDPGIGKSTLLTQTAGSLAKTTGKTLYVSGEESAPQIKRRAERLGSDGGDNLLLLTEVDAAIIAGAIEAEKPDFVIIDSIQTMVHPDLDGVPGSVSQVRACTQALARIAKGDGVSIFLVGHVTKEGAIAGPRVLEHMVDTVLTFEGDRHFSQRILRAVKNRFGGTDEIGVFEMRENGLIEMPNPSEILLSERPENAPGSAVTCIMEGARPLLVEIQALIAPSHMPTPRRAVSGLDIGRVQMVLAVLEKRLRMSMANQDVFINAAGGIRADEPGVDLAIALAAASHMRDIPIDKAIFAAGEVGLAGEVRAVSRVEIRLAEAARLGFTRAIVSKRNKKNLGRRLPENLYVIGVENLFEAVEAALHKPEHHGG
jgi:DNA repair protein RadA/Sms